MLAHISKRNKNDCAMIRKVGNVLNTHILTLPVISQSLEPPVIFLLKNILPVAILGANEAINDDNGGSLIRLVVNSPL